MAAARNTEGADLRRAAILRGVHFEPANAQVHVLDRRRVAGLRRLSEVDRNRQDALGGQATVHQGVVGSITLVPGTAVDVEDSRKGPRPDWSIHARKPGLIAQALVFNVFDVYFEFDVGSHTGQDNVKQTVRVRGRAALPLTRIFVQADLH